MLFRSPGSGGAAGSGFRAGGGSGGTISIAANGLFGAGVIQANGGGDELGGGGGRVFIAYSTLGGPGNDLNGTRAITAYGGRGNQGSGSAGTVVLRGPGQAYGGLYIDDGRDATAPARTPLTHIGFGSVAAVTSDTLTTGGLVRMIPGALAGLELAPNITRAESYRVIANTEDTLTVDLAGGPALDSVAAPGDTYVGVYRFENVTLRGGGFFELGDMLLVSGAMDITEWGVLTHYDAATAFESRLDLTVGALWIAGTGAIDVSGRGYLGGLHNQSEDYGLTLGNLPGSTPYAGGSHGGLGGATSGTPNPVYGNAEQPGALGAGGSRGASGRRGGDGGGRVFIYAGAATVDGVIRADGEAGTGFSAAGGAGGSIWLVTPALDGAGSMVAGGGGNEVGGGGGRVAIVYDGGQSDLGTLGITAPGGAGNQASGAEGTVFLDAGPVAPPAF